MTRDVYEGKRLKKNRPTYAKMAMESQCIFWDVVGPHERVKLGHLPMPAKPSNTCKIELVFFSFVERFQIKKKIKKINNNIEKKSKSHKMNI